MTWVGSDAFTRRPLVVVEDHLHHITELLAALAEADSSLLTMTTVLCLDRAGPDTSRLVARWLATYPTLQVAASLGRGDETPRDVRRSVLDPAVFKDATLFYQTVKGMLRPGGLLLQDVQLSTLAFIPPDRWWESIYLANTVRGMFAENPPTCRFVSNKRGYAATFGSQLIEAGFDPRDVMDKGELRQTVVPVVRSYLARAFPHELRIADSGEGFGAAVANTEEDRREVESELDLVVWREGPGIKIGGRLLKEGRRLSFKPGSQEAATWNELIEDRFRGGNGIEVVAVGKRVAPEGAGRAEITNHAARHILNLRSRLTDGSEIVTADHAYRLAEGRRVGRVTPRLQPAET